MYKFYMSKALELAASAAAADEIPVAALVVCDGEIIASATNETRIRQDATAHAEILAMQSAKKVLAQQYLQNCTLYVTLEPCPMCAGAIVLSRIGEVVYGSPDSLWGACGSLFNVPENPQTNFKVKVIGGIMEQECAKVLKDFFMNKRKRDA